MGIVSKHAVLSDLHKECSAGRINVCNDMVKRAFEFDVLWHWESPWFFSKIALERATIVLFLGAAECLRPEVVVCVSVVQPSLFSEYRKIALLGSSDAKPANSSSKVNEWFLSRSLSATRRYIKLRFVAFDNK